MQVTPLPTPVLPTVMPQEAVAKAIPQIQAQAVQPLIQRAVDPAPRGEKGNKSRNNSDKAKGGGSGGKGDKRGGTLNKLV